MEEKKYKLTDKQFQIFKKEVKYWLKRYGLLDWELYFTFKKDTEFRAQLNYKFRAHIAHFYLSSEWGVIEPTTIIIRKQAHHEVLELLLARFGTIAESRCIMESELDETRHAVIQALINEKWDIKDI